MENFTFMRLQGWQAIDRATNEAVGTILHVVDQGAYPMLEVDFGEGQTGFIPLPDHVEVTVNRGINPLNSTCQRAFGRLSVCG